MAIVPDRCLVAHFPALADPRVERTKLHPLENILRSPSAP
jgi:hypothetical protein